VNRRQFFSRTLGAAAAVAVAPHLPPMLTPAELPDNTADVVGAALDAAIKGRHVEFGYGFEVTSEALDGDYCRYQSGDVARRLAETARRIQEKHAVQAFTVSR
jgi:hypothetical protein